MRALFKSNRNLLIIALIAVVNALGYGIIIPILYSYSKSYGLSDFQNGLLFAIFAFFQFLSTPLIGRLSDKYGRKPLLIISISGTVVSFILMALAPNAIILFIARALDGATAGNIPVATAVISDTTEPKDRTRGFGIIGASFGLGFVIGPAISALTVGISHQLPFYIAATISLIAVILTALFLPETNKHIGEVKKSKLFNFSKLFHALYDPNVGATLLISFFYFFSLFSFIYAFQPYLVKALHLSVNQISAIFTLFGVIGLIMQIAFVQRIKNRFGLKKSFRGALILNGAALLCMFAFRSFAPFIASLVLFSFSNAIIQPLTTTILSQETDAKSQGSILGLNASYMSIGQILGPIVAGGVATYGINYPFLMGSGLLCICFYLSFKVLRPNIAPESAF